MANVSRLLSGAPGGVDLLSKLEIGDDDDAQLRTARLKIRNRLRTRINGAAKQTLRVDVTPRFFTQGSFVYKTINLPAWSEQHIDMDDGAYLPMTFVKGAKPSIAAAAFFEIVDSALLDLIREEGWRELIERPTCSRVVLNKSAHIDIPLYTIPDSEFVTLQKSITQDRALARANEDFDFMQSRRPDTWQVLPSDKVLLAHREEDWKASDPRKIHDWFLGAVGLYGEILRRQCRYLKAWRDHKRLDRISSIILMVYAWQTFEETGVANIPRRDDLMLLKIAERLPDLMAQAIDNPADRSEKLSASWSFAERRAAIQHAADLREQLTSTIHQCYLPEVAVERMRSVFGGRIANRQDLVGVHSAAEAEVRSHAKTYAPAPLVGRSISG
jgi:hypothetical protein